MSSLAVWVEDITGHRPRDLALFERALTHPSRGGADYQRLEFLGDRVLGLAVADWLLESFPDEPEGQLSTRLHALVSGAICADVARGFDVQGQVRLGTQAQNDGAFASDNVLGDVMEAIIGALYLDTDYPTAAAFVRRAWGDRVASVARPPKHPKAALQEWAAANNRKPPVYEVVERSGPEHAPRFVIRVSVRGVGEAEAKGANKQEAEREAAKTLLGQIS